MSREDPGSFAALAIAHYRTLFIGTLGSFSAFFMSTALQGIVAFELTGTNSAVGSAVFGQGLGMLLFGPIGGAYADRLPKRRVIAVGQLISALVFAALGLLYLAERLMLVHLVLGAFLVGVCFAMLGPARQALVVDLVPDSLIFTTDSGRLVFGGGGILPDYLVRLDTVDAALRMVIGRRLDDGFARARLTRLGDSFRQQWQGREDEFTRTYSIDDETFASFLAFAGQQGIEVVDVRPAEESDDPVLVRSEAIASRSDIATRIKAFIARRLFGVEAFYPVVGSIDKTLVEAMKLWDAASDLAMARPGQ